ncbi:uncharacterized protein PV09_02817 [Verruconis gallopava]|uniref:Uncharacterized protein n=1 Tax=Verruconis gallopava TaxID=253628 RepID=A0A0D2AIH0_9PEZI|nr:uncharacterized protein PV09_02817 [Verruconis gallopava]KIW06355.1 hypothetical protein PV09_02817 [Verruconis gallopava]
MKSWRSRGFVLDSDDEDDGSVESQEQERPRQFDFGVLVDRNGQTSPSSVRRELLCASNNSQTSRPELSGVGDGDEKHGINNSEDGFQPIEHVENLFSLDKTGDVSNSQRTYIREDDSESSPLSSVLPDAEDIICGGRIQDFTLHTHEGSGGSPSSLPHSPSFNNSDILSGIQEGDSTRSDSCRSQWAGPQRNFRRRTAIQMHPYLILDGQYVKDMQERGIRPTRVRQPSLARQAYQQVDASQSDSEEDSQSTFRSSPPPCLPQTRLRSSEIRPGPTQQRRRQAEVHKTTSNSQRRRHSPLPALDEILKQKSQPPATYNGRKRRKLQSETSDMKGQDASAQTRASSVENRHTMFVHSPDVETPLSTRSLSEASQELLYAVGRGGFRLPVGFSELKPPTPIASPSQAVVRRGSRDDASIETSPAPHISAATHIGNMSGAKSDSEEEQSCSDVSSRSSDMPSETEMENGELKVIRQRIKGVLPASWLKLDVKAQEKMPTRRPGKRRQQDFRSSAQQPGLARRRLKPSNFSRSARDTLEVSADDELEDEIITPRPRQLEERYQKSTTTPHPELSSFFPNDDPSDDMEENTIDFMLVSEPHRKRKKLGTIRSRQISLLDAFDQASKRSGMQSASRKVIKKRTKSTTRFKPPKLSVLDVIPSSTETAANIPTFLKIARRQAKKYPDQARERPVKKLIRLQTREDTCDAQSVLSDWLSGRLKQRTHSLSTSLRKRPPLTERDPNSIKSLSLTEASPFIPISRTVRKSEVLSESMDGLPTQKETGQKKNKRQIQISKRPVRQKPPHIHTGQLEAEEHTMTLVQDRLRFQRNVYQKDRAYSSAEKPALQLLPRTLAELESKLARRAQDSAEPLADSGLTARSSSQPRPVRHRRLRKMNPNRLDIDTAAYRQPDEYVLPVPRRSPSHQIAKCGREVLHDLNPWGMPYGRNFDVLPLPSGTYFHASTFIGSGNFKKALSCRLHNSNDRFESHKVILAGKHFYWGSWNEELSRNVRTIFEETKASLTTELQSVSQHTPQDLSLTGFDASIRSIEGLLIANSEWLSFTDPVDRSACGYAYLNELEELQMLMEEHFISKNNSYSRALLRFIVRLCIVTAQILIIVRDAEISSEEKRRFLNLLQRQGGTIISYLQERGLEEIRAFYEKNQRHFYRESGIRDEEASIEALVVLVHTFEAIDIPELAFWKVFNTKVLESVDLTVYTGSLEVGWLSIFMLLPTFEIDIDGIHRPGRRFQIAYDNWDGVKKLLSRTLALYHASTSLPGTTINDYVRVLFLRCHDLIQAWAWRRCESILGVIFDFFAKREYMSLVREDRLGSAPFLEQLARAPLLNANEDEKSFHIFLKITAVGLQNMRRVYVDTKLRSILWRWIPNHNRTLDKDKELRTEDLDALRNQHDLLATLYWASPVGYRPRIDLIQNLVDHSTSHLEACRINIKSWSNLASFQLSTDEPVQNVGPFSKWLRDVLEQNVLTYRHARSELEAQYETERIRGNKIMSAESLDMMISRNQNGIISALTEAIAGMRVALKSAVNVPAAWSLLRDSNIPIVLGMFDAKSKKINKFFLELLAMFEAFMDLTDRQNLASTSQTTDQESQDYGEWPEEDDVPLGKSPAEQILDYLLEQASTLLSNIFGSEVVPDEELLTKMVEQWARLGIIMVRRKRATLETFLGDYGRHSWSQLRDTCQRRKYSPYFLSCLLKHDPSAIRQHHERFLTTWMCSLVDREVQLKFQHLLTADLLNVFSDSPLLKNLPFTRVSTSDAYAISSVELRERRLALLSSVLSNMRDEYQRKLQSEPGSIRGLRAEYSSLLSQVMLQMRRNYEDLRQGESIIGSYVTFVQTMIEFMQQYTGDICPVDKYFTDSAAFPLPSKDPTYLVGRLKSYEQKLNDTKGIKQLIMFVQNVSERAAIDNQQEYLTRQLLTAMDDFLESEHSQTYLSSIMLRIIFPVYIEGSLSDSSMWILARPFLNACKSLLKDAIFKFSALNTSSAQAATSTIISITSSMTKAASALEFSAENSWKPYILATLSLMFEVATVCIPSLDYIQRRRGRVAAGIMALNYFKDFSLYAAKSVLGMGDAFPPIYDGNHPSADSRTVELKAFCAQKLQEDLRSKWRHSHGRHEVRRGTTWTELQINVESLDEEKAILVHRIEQFHEALDRAKSL